MYPRYAEIENPFSETFIYLCQWSPRRTPRMALMMIIRCIDRLHLLFAPLSSAFYLRSSFRLFLLVMLSVIGVLLSCLHSQLFSRFHPAPPTLVHFQRIRETVGSILIISSTCLMALKFSLKLLDCLARTTSYYIQRWGSGRKTEAWYSVMMMLIGLALIENIESWFVCSKSNP